jgi:hypothetical protein
MAQCQKFQLERHPTSEVVAERLKQRKKDEGIHAETLTSNVPVFQCFR